MNYHTIFTQKFSIHRSFTIPIWVAIIILMLAALPVYAQGPAGETTAITATNGVYFGEAVDVDNDTAVVGAHGVNSNQGAAYIFKRNSGGSEAWGQVITLTGHAAGDWFGSAVAIDGDTLAVGARKVLTDGAVYIFDRNQDGADNWGRVITVTVTGSGSGDDFGSAVALDGDTLVVGALDAQSAYVFERNQSGADNWGLVTTLTVTATGVVTPYGFGYSVAVDGDTIVVGAIGSKVNGNSAQGAAYVFTRNQGGADNWGVAAVLTDTIGQSFDQFGHAVAIDRDRIVVTSINAASSTGLAKLFERNAGGVADSWHAVKAWLGSSTGDAFGNSVAISGDTVIIGALLHDVNSNSDQGASYVYRRNRGGLNVWGLDTKLTASDGVAGDQFGSAVALDVTNNVFLIGAAEANSSQGKVYIFNSSGNFWKERAAPVATDAAANDHFGGTLDISDSVLDVSGGAVDISGGVLLVGAPDADPADVSGAGEAYIFYRNRSGKDGWGQVITLTHSSAAAGDHLGSAVALDNDTALVSAPNEEVGGNTNAGAAYIFERNQSGADNWGQVAALTASDSARSDFFGASVAIDNDTALVGAPQHDVNGNNNQGAAYIFERNQGGVTDSWGQVTVITATDGVANDAFGNSVAISGDTAIVGAYRADPNGHAQEGAAYIFYRNEGGVDNWGQVIKLTQGNGSDAFGYAVAIDGDIAAVSASYAAPNGSNTGAVYVFERNQGGADNWGLVATLAPSILEANDWVDASIDISGDTIVVSSRYAGSHGKVYVFDRNEGGTDNWGLSGVWESSDANVAQFGISSAIDANTVVVSDSYADVGANGSQGRAYVYQLVVTPDLSISKSVTPDTADPGDTITYTLTYSNHGTIPAFGVVITDAIPISVTNVSCSSSGALITPTGSISYVWNVADLNVGDSGTITISGVLSNGLLAQTFTNTAQIDATNEGWQTDNTASAMLTVGDVTVQGLALTSDSPAFTGETVHFTATITNGYNVSYDWAFGDGSTDSTGATATAHHIYSASGTYTAIVTASNTVSSQVATTTVVVTDTAITGLTVTGTSPVALGTDPNLRASITAGSNVSYDWDFGNGDTCPDCGTSPVMHDDNAGIWGNYNYTAVGTYTVVVTAWNTVNTQVASTTIEVTPAYDTYVYLPLVLK